MINVYRSQLLLLNRRRTWTIAGLATLVFTVSATLLGISSAEPARAGGGGLALEALAGPGGATAGVIWAVSFGAILVLVTFISTTGNDFARGTFRTALLHHPGRWTYLAGKVAALMTVTLVLMLAALLIGWATAAAVAPGNDVDTTGWFGLEALAQAGGDFGRLAAWAFGHAVIGTTIAVLCRSTPVALGIGIVWFGPVENILSDDVAAAFDWFPGLLLRAIVAPGNPEVASTGRAVAMVAAYTVVCVAVIATAVQRRDVTS
jgi:hypothetical protein